MSHSIPAGSVIGVIGAGAMGAGIAQVALQAGHVVRLLDKAPGAAAKAVRGINATLARLVEKGKLSREAAAACGERLFEAEAPFDLRDAALVVEAIVERLDIKRTLFADLEDVVSPSCILATNTSSLSITAVAAGLREPQRVVGMHFFNPAPLMALVEIVSGLATAPGVAQAVFDTAAAWGKLPVHAKSTPGFIVNRVARPYYAEGMRLLTEQAGDVATIDAVMREAGGFRMGPFELTDMIGHDVNFAVTQSVFQAYFGDPRFTPSLVQQELVNAGWYGRKSGRGFYDYAEGAVPPQPATEAPMSLSSAPIVLWCDTTFGQALAVRLADAGVPFERRTGAAPFGQLMNVGRATVALTDGRTATERAARHQVASTVLADLVLDPATAKRIALAPADTCDEKAFHAAVAAFQAAGFAVTRLGDVPGLAVMRTVAMLANEAADAVNQGVCDVADADAAMRLGANYPLGPLTWADRVGLDLILAVLDNLAAVYGEDRYRASALLRRRVAAGRRFHFRSTDPDLLPLR
jgi:3-hydroxybutyryl-CoA dehydrogenase